ncbi:TetR/AcrR family transcriptional regulator [Lysobacter korlensis]|uniref:TetR/AcrR family transcriptional regulator n=1 Tax=Lysobacter korlensis TaxID=553636 RepID=A0ABV6RZ68_9GAMM
MKPYHRGNLDQQLLTTARALLEEAPSTISLREVARRTDVSHAAAAHHFKDKRGLLTALAAYGFRLLAEALAEAGDDFLEVAVEYVKFATGNPGLYSLMFDPRSVDGRDPALAEARAEAGRPLQAGIGRIRDVPAAQDPRAATLAAFALVHGFATLQITGYLEVEQPAEEMTRRLGRMLFREVSAP